LDFKRVYIEKKPGFDIESVKVFTDLRENLQLKELQKVRIFQIIILTISVVQFLKMILQRSGKIQTSVLE